MKNYIIILLLAFLCAGKATAQIEITSFTPSVYYTHGNYSNNISSGSIAGYGVVGVNYFDYLVTGVEKINIESNEWNYDQYNLSFGLIKNIYPFYAHANYMHVNGKLKWKGDPYNYKDNINIVNAGISYNYSMWYLNADYSYLDLNGFKSVVSRQYKVGLNFLATDYLTLSGYFVNNNLTDNRNLNSFIAGLSYEATRKVYVSLNASFGERAYYFDSEKLILFNQDATQKNLFEVKVNYRLSDNFNGALSFQSTQFKGYDILYTIIGLKAYF